MSDRLMSAEEIATAPDTPSVMTDEQIRRATLTFLESTPDGGASKEDIFAVVEWCQQGVTYGMLVELFLERRIRVVVKGGEVFVAGPVVIESPEGP